MDRWLPRTEHLLKVCGHELKAKPVLLCDFLHGMYLLQCLAAECRVWVLWRELGRREEQGSYRMMDR